MKILCTSDIHIGRRSSRIPENLDTDHFSASKAWESIVDFAIQREVDALLLAGDIVDQDNNYYEAFGPLESGLKRLAQKNIPTIAIAGNHDFDVLSRLEEYVGREDFHLLGRNGEWESHTLYSRNNSDIQIWGWSFPSRYVNYNPIDKFQPVNDSDIPKIGLMHADLDQLNSQYAPVRTQDLVNQPMTTWIVGHTHHPYSSFGNNEIPILIPGSPQSLDPGEPGIHGPWLIQFENNHIQNITQIPLSKVRYDEILVNLNGIDDEYSWEGLVPNAIREFYSVNEEKLGNLELLLFRIVLEGRTQLHLRLPELIQRLEQNLTLYDGTVRIEKIINRSQPNIDLEQLSISNDLPGIIAKVLLDLQSGQETKYAILI